MPQLQQAACALTSAAMSAISKSDLIFTQPVMNAAGMLGLTPDPRAPVAWKALGAFITNPISLRRRSATAAPAALEYPGGFLLHTGLPNPGFRAVLTTYAGRWAQAPLPIIVHLMGDRPEEAMNMTRQLEGLENVLGVELSFAPLLADDIILLAVEMCAGELPVIACLPQEQVPRLGASIIARGAAAVSLAAPRGSLRRAGRTLSGRLYGPSLFPQSLETVQVAARIGVPVIGAGGISSESDVQAMLAAGALAVQLDSTLWLPRQAAENLAA